jgi:2,5-diamino-6-(ribosylamino)-4(3H)-pyrimidinone 5'-phosphate reductase
MTDQGAENQPGPPLLLKSIYPAGFFRSTIEKHQRPFVTLTYAQSLDGCIAGEGGSQISLSGMPSMVMTHWKVSQLDPEHPSNNGLHVCRMRTLHDGILVGINTLRNDNPQLNSS